MQRKKVAGEGKKEEEAEVQRFVNTGGAGVIF